jgi:hypothetical protein
MSTLLSLECIRRSVHDRSKYNFDRSINIYVQGGFKVAQRDMCDMVHVQVHV